MSPWHLLQRSQHRKCFSLWNCQVLNLSCGTAISSEHSSNHWFPIGFLDGRVRKSKFSARKRNGQPFCYHQDFLRSSELLWCHGGPGTDLSHNREVKFLSLPSLHSTVFVRQCQSVKNMASVSDFVPVRRELIKNTPPKPFLIGVAGGSASGKVKAT